MVGSAARRSGFFFFAMFYVSYLVGGSSNFTAKSCTAKYVKRNDPKLLKELAEVRNMGYLAMVANVTIGGFESYNCFDDSSKRAEYYDFCKRNYASSS